MLQLRCGALNPQRGGFNLILRSLKIINFHLQLLDPSNDDLDVAETLIDLIRFVTYKLIVQCQM